MSKSPNQPRNNNWPEDQWDCNGIMCEVCGLNEDSPGPKQGWGPCVGTVGGSQWPQYYKIDPPFHSPKKDRKERGWNAIQIGSNANPAMCDSYTDCPDQFYGKADSNNEYWKYGSNDPETKLIERLRETDNPDTSTMAEGMYDPKTDDCLVTCRNNKNRTLGVIDGSGKCIRNTIGKNPNTQKIKSLVVNGLSTESTSYGLDKFNADTSSIIPIQALHKIWGSSGDKMNLGVNKRNIYIGDEMEDIVFNLGDKKYSGNQQVLYMEAHGDLYTGDVGGLARGPITDKQAKPVVRGPKKKAPNCFNPTTGQLKPSLKTDKGFKCPNDFIGLPQCINWVEQSAEDGNPLWNKRVGGCGVTRDNYGPGVYNMLCYVPKTEDKSNGGRGYVFAIWPFHYEEIYEYTKQQTQQPKNKPGGDPVPGFMIDPDGKPVSQFREYSTTQTESTKNGKWQFAKTGADPTKTFPCFSQCDNDDLTTSSSVAGVCPFTTQSNCPCVNDGSIALPVPVGGAGDAYYNSSTSRNNKFGDGTCSQNPCQVMGTCDDPSAPWGTDMYSSDQFAVVNHEIDIEIPANPAAWQTANSNNGVTDANQPNSGLYSWLKDMTWNTMNCNTWVNDINNYDENSGAYYSEVAIRKRGEGDFISDVPEDSKDPKDYHWYTIDWFVDNKDWRNNYVSLYFDDPFDPTSKTTIEGTLLPNRPTGEPLHKTKRFIPTRPGRLNFGPWMAWWGYGGDHPDNLTPHFDTAKVRMAHLSIIPYGEIAEAMPERFLNQEIEEFTSDGTTKKSKRVANDYNGWDFPQGYDEPGTECDFADLVFQKGCPPPAKSYRSYAVAVSIFAMLFFFVVSYFIVKKVFNMQANGTSSMKSLSIILACVILFAIIIPILNLENLN